MKKLITIVLLSLSFSVVGAAQQSMTPGMQNAPARKSPLAEYAGSWVAVLEGHPWLTLHLSMRGDQLFGTVQRPHDFQFSDDGAIKSVSQEQLTQAVQNAQVQGDGLLITVKDQSSQQADRYVMRLTGASTAELKMVGMSMPPGMPKPRPWMLSRIGPNAVTPTR